MATKIKIRCKAPPSTIITMNRLGEAAGLEKLAAKKKPWFDDT